MANPTINQSGSATVTPGQNCTITTSNGATSTITISNPSNSNNVMLAISGIPAGPGISTFVNNVQSATSNGIFTIPANSPSFTVIEFGNMLGSVITIQNLTSSAVPANLFLTVVTA